MKKGEIVFIIFASIWAILLISSSIVVQDYPLGARIIVILIAIFPLGLYSIIKSVKRSNKKNAEYLTGNQKYKMRDDVAKALSIFRISTIGHIKDIKNAEKILLLNEKALIVLPANYITILDDKNNKNNENLQGIAILTDKRFIFNYKILTNKLTEEVFLNDICFINLIEMSKKRGCLEIHTNTKKYYIFLYYKQKMMHYARDLFIWAKNNAENFNLVLNENNTKYPQKNPKITEQNKIQTYNEEPTKIDVLSTNKVIGQSEKQVKTLVKEENNYLTDTKTVANKTNMFSDDDFLNNGTPLWLLSDDEYSNCNDDLLYQELQETVKYESPLQNINSPSSHLTNINCHPQGYNAGIQILKESYDIMESTNNLDTFFSRYELSKKIAYNLNDPKYLKDYNAYVYKLKERILQRSFQNECTTISKLKTPKAQLKHWENYISLLQRYESQYLFDFHDEYENIIQAVKTKILLTCNENDISEIASKALSSNIKVTVTSDTSDLEKYSREVSEKGYALHVNSYKNLDFSDISIKYDPPKSLKLFEKNFLKALANQQVGNLDFPVYWTYEYKINFKEVITNLIENGYVKIAPATEDLSFLTVEQLKAVLKRLRLPSSGKKQDLIARISNQSGVSNALKELNLDNKHFILTEIGKQAVESVQKPVEKTIKHNNLYKAENDQLKQLENLGVEKYQIIGTLDTHTCSKCGKMDGKVFDLKKYEIGVTAPPFCEDCRCTIMPYFDDDFDDVGERIARGYDGKTYYVPGNMTYSKWKKTIQKQDE